MQRSFSSAIARYRSSGLKRWDRQTGLRGRRQRRADGRLFQAAGDTNAAWTCDNSRGSWTWLYLPAVVSIIMLASPRIATFVGGRILGFIGASWFCARCSAKKMACAAAGACEVRQPSRRSRGRGISGGQCSGVLGRPLRKSANARASRASRLIKGVIGNSRLLSCRAG